jgi:hypothetical protein
MKKILIVLFLAVAFGVRAQKTESIIGTWTIYKVVKIEGMSAAELKNGKAALEGNAFLTFNKDGSFNSTVDTKKMVTQWYYKRKSKTIFLTGKSQKLKIKIIKFKQTSMRVKMQLSRSILGEFVLVKK